MCSPAHPPQARFSRPWLPLAILLDRIRNQDLLMAAISSDIAPWSVQSIRIGVTDTNP